MKFLLLLLATACFVLGGEPARADPISAITAISGWLASASAAVKLIIGIAVTVGQSLLQKALAKKNDSSASRGVDLSVSMGDDVPISFTIGAGVTGGKRKFIGTWGSDGKTPNAHLVDVIELENLPSTGVSGFWAGDTRCTILWNEPHSDGRGFPVSEFRKDGKDHLWFKFRDGSQTAVDDYLFAKFANHPERQVTRTFIGYGCGYAIITCLYSEDLFKSGLPDWAFEMAPRRFYDLRKDSTNGGSGAHRWNNPATWEPTSNLVIVAYNIIRGITYNGEWIYGGQNIAAFRLPSSNWIAGANECDARILLADGSTEPAFRCGYEVNVDREPLEVLEELEKAGNARFVEVGGIFKVLVGAPGAAVYSFTDDDIIVTEDQSFDPFPSLEETFNGIEATYPEPAEKWAMKDAPARYDAALEAADGQRRLPASVAINAAPFANQVQRTMVAMIQDYRRFRVHQFYLPPDAYALEPNDVVSWTSARNGYVEKKFLVTSITGKRTFNRLVSLKEIDPSDYDWSTDKQLPVSTGWIGEIVPPPQPMYGWQVEPAAFFDADGSPRRPSIRISCAAGQEGVTHVWVQVALKATGTIVFDSDQTPYNPNEEPVDGRLSWVLNGTFLPNETYQVRGRFISTLNDNQQWSSWLDVITFNILLANKDVDVVADMTKLGADVKKRFAELQQEMNSFWERHEQIATAFSLVGAVGQIDRQEVRADLAGAHAVIAEERRVRASENDAMAQAVSQVSASIGGVKASVEDERTARTTEDEALASRITQVDARLTDPATGLDAVRARVIAEETARATEDEALASRITQVDARITDPATGLDAVRARVIAEETARATGDEALAESVLGVSAELGDRFAQGLIKFQAVAAPTGVDARFSVLLRSGIGQAYKDTGFFLELYTFAGIQRSRMAIKVDQFSVSDGTTAYSVFAIEGGVVKIINALIDQAQINNLLVGTSNISPGAVSRVDQAAMGGVGTFQLTCYHGTGAPIVRLDVGGKARTGGTINSRTQIVLSNATDGGPALSNFVIAGSTEDSSGFFYVGSDVVLFSPPSLRSQTTFSVTVTGNVLGIPDSFYLIASTFKR